MWILTDDNNHQHARRVHELEKTFGVTYELIEISNLGNLRNNHDSYIVYAGVIYVDDFFEDGRATEELLSTLKTYGYNGFADVYNQYHEGSMQIVAECVFENGGVSGVTILFGGTVEKCIRFIDNYIARCGGRELKAC